ncbi:arylamine N-acetyltransferase [Actinomadura sp. NEAU-AAG7]|uniref:arylamine N-acetyltransferase family protein n=1 Tax=Actinomadura sp. NEAU-AAG7 TaxID=2839640 RepID=UPI001BE429FA|nr:arylamine N-acetyltransferase [Actinomadura sp. NEAU-AAG7]MBT2207435.1 arylamine N-acetyltransferase [Actinomadura sp. NEAU-AAG7]
MTEDLGYGWQSDLLDLPAYLKRVGYDADPRPDAATLRALHRAHVTSIPFENLEAILGRPVELGVEALQAKLVDRRRGGYCFEHTELFAAVLEKIGFEFTALAARVTMGATKLRPTTHALLRVQIPGEPALLCDVGFGSGPLEPLEFPAEGVNEVEQDGWGFRLFEGPRAWELHQRGADGWVQRHTFTLNETFHIDYELFNYFISTSPHSPFTTRAFTQKFSVDSLRVLDGTTLTTTRPDGHQEKRELPPEQLGAVLAEEFGIVLDSPDIERLTAS